MAGIERRIEGVVEEGATLKGNVVVEKGALVRSGSYIEGPVYISSGCDIGPNCYIRPSTCLGKNVRIGASVEVKNSIVMNGTHIPHHNYVGDSIIGERCNFGAGTKVANLRFDNKSVKVSFNGELDRRRNEEAGSDHGRRCQDRHQQHDRARNDHLGAVDRGHGRRWPRVRSDRTAGSSSPGRRPRARSGSLPYRMPASCAYRKAVW